MERRSIISIGILTISRIICLVYLILAAIAIPDASKSKSSNYVVVGSTFYIPIVICDPGAVQVSLNETLSVDANGIQGCRTPDLFVNAVILSLTISMAALIVFVVSDTYGRFVQVTFFNRCFTRPKQSTVSGMGFFLIFVLTQAIGVTWALASECDFWADFYSTQLTDSGLMAREGITAVRTHSDAQLLWATGALGVLAIITVAVESVVFLCIFKPDEEGEEEEEKKDHKKDKKTKDKKPSTPTSEASFESGTEVPESAPDEAYEA